MIVAVVGSRGWRQPGKVNSFVRGVAKKYPGSVIVSGGCQTGRPRKGVDWAAEHAALDVGLRVVSYRPERALSLDLPPMPYLRVSEDQDETEVEERRRLYRAAHADIRAWLAADRQWCVVRYVLSPDLETGWVSQQEHVLPERYSSFGAAAFGRDAIIAEVAQQVVAFHDGESPGTWHVRREAERLGRPLHVRT